MVVLRLGVVSRLTHLWCRQIDRLRTGYATFGQEQLLDIELDRNTPLAPQRDNSISWQTPFRPVATRPMSMPIPTEPVIDETETPDIRVLPAGACSPCDPSNDNPTEASGRVLIVCHILSVLLTVRHMKEPCVVLPAVSMAMKSAYN